MEFASEMVIQATLRRMRVAEVPTILRPDGRSRPPHLNSWRDGWRHLRFMLLHCPRWLFVFPAMTAILLGLLPVAMVAIQGTWRVGRFGLSTNTAMIGAMLTLLGLQLLFCGAFAYRLSVAAGHLPVHRWWENATHWLSSHWGLVVGGGLTITGGLLFAVAFGIWNEADFRGLSPEVTARYVIPSALLILSGVQTLFGSFIAGLIPLCFTSSSLRRSGSHQVGDS
jgi:hypothetical protein